MPLVRGILQPADHGSCGPDLLGELGLRESGSHSQLVYFPADFIVDFHLGQLLLASGPTVIDEPVNDFDRVLRTGATFSHLKPPAYGVPVLAGKVVSGESP